jgi:esterase/lipase superfamily enzyme
MNFRALFLTVAFVLSGCAERRDGALLAPAILSSGTGQRISLLIATSRLRGEEPYSFTSGRSFLLNFQAIELSLPPNHRIGEVETPSSGPGQPASEFAALSNTELDEKSFASRASSAAARAAGELNLFVHGYNTTYEQAVFRFGQIAADAGALGAVVVFSWPSRGRFLDYISDRDSMLFSRERLETLLQLLARQPGVRTINLFGHSMGGLLVMETLRQAKIRGDGEFGGKLNAVVLAQPDIDLDVFRAQLGTIGRRTKPTVLLISQDDKALNFLRLLTGQADRVGVVEAWSPEAMAEIERLGLTVIDLSKLQGDGDANHAKFARSPEVIRQIGNWVEGRNRSARPGLFKAPTDGKVFEVRQ